MKKIKSRDIRIKKSIGIRRLSVVMVIVMVFLCNNCVDAGMNDSLLKKERVEGVFAVTKIDNIDRIFYLNMYDMNGRVSYCIDLGVDIITSIYNSTNDFSVSYLSDDQIDYIRSISYFGYGYIGHDVKEYYMAAQELIWEYLGDVDVEWVNEMKVDGNRIDIDFYKEQILELKNNYDKKLLLNNEVVYKVGDRIEFVDDRLLEYEVVSSNYSEVFIEENKLIIKVGNVIGDERIVLRKKDYYDYDSSLYYFDGSQRLISNGNYKSMEEVINFKIDGFSLRVVVNDSGINMNFPRGEASLEGAMYEVYDNKNNLIGIYETDNNGRFVVDDVLIGKYYIKQVMASNGYIINKSNTKVDINADNMEVVLKQEVMSNNFRLKKLYGSDGDYKFESGIMFSVYDSNNKHYMYLFTDGAGIVDFNLPYGSYVVKQETTTTGYSKVDDFVIDVCEHNTNLKYYNLIDEKIKTKVRVSAIDKDNGNVIRMSGFSYKLRRKDNEVYLESDGNNVFGSDVNGNLIIPISLEYGHYVLEQIGIPREIVNKEDVNFIIDDSSNFELVDGELMLNVNVNNEFVKGKVDVVSMEEKYFKDINEYRYEMIVRGNDSFNLVADGEIIVNGQVVYSDLEVVYSGVTDLDGNLSINNLYLGNYCLVNDNGDKQCFSLDIEDGNNKVVKKKIEFVNKLSKGNIIISNKEKEGKVIGDSVFELIDDDDMVIYTGITNSDGLIKINDVLFGKYCIKQNKVIDEYEKNSNVMCFEVDGNEEIEVINNLLVKDVIRVPDTLDDRNILYDMLVFLVLIGTGLIVYKKIFCSKLYR